MILLLSVLACQKSVVPPFPAGLEPLADCSAGLPGADGQTPEEARSVSGEGEEHLYAHVCGYVHAPVETVWEAIQDPDVVSDRRRIAEYALVESDIDPDYDVSFLLHYLVEDIITVEYDVEWRQGVWEADDEDRLSVAARFQKVEGSSLIELIEGSVVLAEAEAEVTRFELISHHKSIGYTADELELKATDLYDSVVAFSHGEPLPTYE